MGKKRRELRARYRIEEHAGSECPHGGLDVVVVTELVKHHEPDEEQGNGERGL